jgi:hypothetical protein
MKCYIFDIMQSNSMWASLHKFPCATLTRLMPIPVAFDRDAYTTNNLWYASCFEEYQRGPCYYPREALNRSSPNFGLNKKPLITNPTQVGEFISMRKPGI